MHRIAVPVACCLSWVPCLLSAEGYSYTQYIYRCCKCSWRSRPGRSVSRTSRDQAGDLWFTTIGNDVYRLNPEAVRTIYAATEYKTSEHIEYQSKYGQPDGTLLEISFPAFKDA